MSDLTPAAMQFVSVRKKYGSATALAGVTLQIQVGESFALAGLNGAGKTTLIKCLLDFCRADAGNIEIFGEDNRSTHSRSRLAFLPERFNPPYYLTGRDFLRFMLELQGVAYREANAADMLVALDLEVSALVKPVRTFSKGMTQKLGLAGCLLSSKDLYILDEPTSGLDPKARALLKARLRGLRAQGRTVFFTSHSLADVDEISDRMAVIHNGQIRYAGTPAQLRADYGAATLEAAFLACIGTTHCEAV